MDDVFKALADPSRRVLLDALFHENGQTVTDLCDTLEMTRFGVMKHLRVLESARLVVSRKRGRERRHYLNVVPIQEIYDRWVRKFQRVPARALVELKRALEERYAE